MKYADWLDSWITMYCEPIHKYSTCQKYKLIVNHHLKKELGNFDVNELNITILQSYISKLQKKLAVNTIKGIVSVIKMSLKRAVEANIIHTNSSEKIICPNGKEKGVDCFTVEEQQKIEDYILQNKKRKRLFGIVLCLYTGLRIGELLALQWDNIDFKNETILVSKTCFDTWGKDGYQKKLQTPKTQSSYRLIPIAHPIILYLLELYNNRHSLFLLEGKGDDGIHVRSYQKTFAALLKKLGIEHKGFHALRHTFATRAIEDGMDVKTLSEILGHKNSLITLNRYTHSLLEHKRAMMNQLGKRLSIKKDKKRT